MVNIGAITGLADLDDKADGSSVANKSMWTTKCNPLMATVRLFTIWTEKSGERDQNGSFHKEG